MHNLSRRLGLVVLAWVLGLGVSAPVVAIDITNTDPEHPVKLSLDYWVRQLGTGETARFHPDTVPLRVYGQYPYANVSCDVQSADDVVSLSQEGCRVNGVATGRHSIRF